MAMKDYGLSGHERLWAEGNCSYLKYGVWVRGFLRVLNKGCASVPTLSALNVLNDEPEVI